MGITKDNFDAVLPENYKLVYMGELAELQGQTQSETLEAIYTKFNIDHPADYKAHSLSVSDIVVLHENGENTAHFVDSFGFTELPKFMLTLEGKENEIETELAVHIADRYILMHECDEGYDYSILNEQYHLLDGGVYDNPDITIQRAMDMVIADLKEPRFSAVTEQYYRDEFCRARCMQVPKQRLLILRNFRRKPRKWNRQIWKQSRQNSERTIRMWLQISGQGRKNCFTVWTDRVRKILKNSVCLCAIAD